MALSFAMSVGTIALRHFLLPGNNVALPFVILEQPHAVME